MPYLAALVLPLEHLPQHPSAGEWAGLWQHLGFVFWEASLAIHGSVCQGWAAWGWGEPGVLLVLSAMWDAPCALLSLAASVSPQLRGLGLQHPLFYLCHGGHGMSQTPLAEELLVLLQHCCGVKEQCSTGGRHWEAKSHSGEGEKVLNSLFPVGT